MFPSLPHVKPINFVLHSSVGEEQFDLTPKQDHNIVGHNNDPLLWSGAVEMLTITQLCMQQLKHVVLESGNAAFIVK